MNEIGDVSSYDLPEIGIKSLRDYQDIEHIKSKGLDSLLLQTSETHSRGKKKHYRGPPQNSLVQTESSLGSQLEFPHGQFGGILHMFSFGLFGS